MSERPEFPHPQLTLREADVLGLVARGLSSQQVADSLSLSKRTVDDHLSKVYAKLGVGNRVQALHAAVRIGVVSPELMHGPHADGSLPPQG